MKNNVIKHIRFQLYSSCTEGNSVIIQFKFILILVSVQLNRYYYWILVQIFSNIKIIFTSSLLLLFILFQFSPFVFHWQKKEMYSDLELRAYKLQFCFGALSLKG